MLKCEDRFFVLIFWNSHLKTYTADCVHSLKVRINNKDKPIMYKHNIYINTNCVQP